MSIKEEVLKEMKNLTFTTFGDEEYDKRVLKEKAIDLTQQKMIKEFKEVWEIIKEKMKPIIENECKGKGANCYIIKKGCFKIIDEELKKQVEKT